MNVDPIAERYAEALFESAKAEEQLDQVQQALALLGRLLTEQPMLGALLLNPEMTTERKLAVMDQAFGDGLTELVRAFVRMVVSVGRVEWLPGMVEAFAALVDADRGLVRVTVRSTHPLSERTLQRLRHGLEQREQKDVELGTELDPSLLGGLQIRLGHRVIDASVRRHLAELRQQLKSIRV